MKTERRMGHGASPGAPVRAGHLLASGTIQSTVGQPGQQLQHGVPRGPEAAAVLVHGLGVIPGSIQLVVASSRRRTAPTQAERHGRLGLRLYAPMTVEQSYQWEPADTLGPGHAPQVAGVEAAIWAETVSDFDDLSFLLLPRLPGVAEKAWAPAHATTWTDHRTRLARHHQIWAQDDLTYFTTPGID